MFPNSRVGAIKMGGGEPHRGPRYVLFRTRVDRARAASKMSDVSICACSYSTGVQGIRYALLGHFGDRRLGASATLDQHPARLA
jgi:hypothetical protein